VGANPEAAKVAGRIDAAHVAGMAFLAGGGLAGLAGAVEVSGVTFALYESLSPGYGYTAIVVALLGRLDPLAIVPSAILFGALESGALAMQREAGIPSVVVTAIEAVLVLTVLLADRWTASRRAPNEAGNVFPDAAHDASDGGHPPAPSIA
jgi:simple sugar transport system permease protein